MGAGVKQMLILILILILIFLAIALASVIKAVIRARRLRKFRSESVVLPSAEQPSGIDTSISIKDEQRSRLEPGSDSSKPPLPETGTFKEKAGESIEKPTEGPDVMVSIGPAPAPSPGELAVSKQAEEVGEQSLQPGGSAKEQAEGNIPQQTAQSEKRDTPASPDAYGPSKSVLAAGPQEPKVSATQSASGADVTPGVRVESKNEGGVPGRFIYQPPVIKPPKSQPRTAAQPSPKQREERRGQPLEVSIQAIFDRHGFCQIRLLGQRFPDSEQEIEVSSGRKDFVLSAYGDAWYEINAGERLSELLSEGFQFSARDSGTQSSWRLSGRDVYVLAGYHGLAGSVSTTWLRIGREDQVVLCKAGRAEEVRAVLDQAGCGQLEAHREDYGAPAGWVFFRGVKPLRTLPHSSGNDILNILRPLPEVEIELDGGLWLYDSVWLTGFPPKISVSGDIPPHTEVRIDNHPAVLQANGGFIASGWDGDGNHIVWCGGTQAKYSIASPSPGWDLWQPYDYADGTLCGAIATPRHAAQLVTVPTTNRVLLGAKPGEVFRCEARAGTEWTGFVPFEVVWAVPDNALHSDKNLHRVRLIAPISPGQQVETRTSRRKERLTIWRWCQAILDCKRKGLLIWPIDSETERLWQNYSLLARAIWRTLRQHGTK